MSRSKPIPLRGAPKLETGCGKVNSARWAGSDGRLSTVDHARPLTEFAVHCYLPKLDLKRRSPMDWAVRNEADVQATQSQACQQARVPREDEDSGRSRHSLPSPEEGPRAPRGDGGQQVGTTESGAGERLPREARVRHTNEIRALLERGKRKRTKHVEVFLAPSPVSFCRLGVIVPKHGRRIVERNLLKRRIREIGRKIVLPFLRDQGLTVDVLVRARREAYQVEFETLDTEIRQAVEALCSEGS